MCRSKAFKEKSYAKADGSLNVAISDGILERFCSDLKEPLNQVIAH